MLPRMHTSVSVPWWLAVPAVLLAGFLCLCLAFALTCWPELLVMWLFPGDLFMAIMGWIASAVWTLTALLMAMRV